MTTATKNAAKPATAKQERVLPRAVVVNGLTYKIRYAKAGSFTSAIEGQTINIDPQAEPHSQWTTLNACILEISASCWNATGQMKLLHSSVPALLAVSLTNALAAAGQLPGTSRSTANRAYKAIIADNAANTASA